MTDVATSPASPAKWGTRILNFPLTRIVLALICVLVPFLGLQLVLKLEPVRAAFAALVPEKNARQAMVLLVLAALATAGYCLYVRWIEKRKVIEFGPSGAPLEMASGLALGAILISLTIGVLAALGAYRITGSNPYTVLFVPLAEMIMAGFFEEILFRGIVFRILEHRLGSWIALAISAVLFGAMHVGNPNATAVSTIAIMLEAGVLLGAAFMLTHRLWLCIGIHIAWNFGEGAIYSTPVSGQSATGLLVGSLTGPEWLTGGAFGVEASTVAIVICTTLGVLLLIAAVRRGHVIRPYWRRSKLIAPAELDLAASRPL